MAQTSIAAFFNTRKRVATDDLKINRARKVLVVDDGDGKLSAKAVSDNNEFQDSEVETNESKQEISEVEKVVPNKIVSKSEKPRMARRTSGNKSSVSKRRPSATLKGQQDIQSFVNTVPTIVENTSEILNEHSEIKHVTPPASPIKIQNGMDKVLEKPKDASLHSMKTKLLRSSRLAELKASLSRFGELQKKQKEVEKITSKISVRPPESPTLQKFKAIELEVHLSPQKVQSPEKLYLSPKKNSTARKNLFNLLSPTKNSVALSFESPSKKIEEETSKPALTLPRKYRFIAEMFRAIDTVCQLLYNRKETITFSKLKPAVENMTKRELSQRCLGQIKKIYPDAFKYDQEKLRVFGNGRKEEKWELVLTPQIGGDDHMNSNTLLSRRRVLFDILLDKVKDYHHEFLMSLESSVVLPKKDVKRWHPEFNIEKVPDIEEDSLPQPPEEMKMTSGKEVLEKARDMFNCNTKMEQALLKLKQKKLEKSTETNNSLPISTLPNSLLKGLPDHLLQKVRQRMAAKSIILMTRSADKEQELKIYSRLPELAKLTKNLFVSEKKNVLKLDEVIEKLGNCYRVSLSNTEMEEHIKLLVKELPEWLVLHQALNKIWFLKQLNRNVEVNVLRNKLEAIVKVKSDQLNS